MPGDFGARGEFSDRANAFSGQWFLNKHRRVAGILAGAALLTIAGALLTRRHSNGSLQRALPQPRRVPLSSHLQD